MNPDIAKTREDPLKPAGSVGLHPLEIPEVLSAIINYLPQGDQVCCLRVSKAFHAASVRYIWRKIKVTHPPEGREKAVFPSGSSLERNKHHIREIEFQSLYPEQYLSLRDCLNLLSVVVCSSDPEDLTDGNIPALSEMIAAHSFTIRSIEAAMPYAPPVPALWCAIDQCCNLQTLIWRYAQVPKESAGPFLRICSRATTLHLMNIVGLDWPNTMSEIEYQDTCTQGAEGVDEKSIQELTGLSNCGSIPWRARDLVIQDCQSLSRLPANVQVEIIRRCPNLTSLLWVVGGFDPSPSKQLACDKELYEALSHGVWPVQKIHSLNLVGSVMMDKILAKLFDRMQEIRRITAVFSRLGPLSIQALVQKRALHENQPSHRLCDYIEHLRLGFCAMLTSRMTQVLLESCPKLKVFHAGTITAVDILLGRPWVCHSLKELHIRVELGMDDPTAQGVSSEEISEMQSAMFSQFGSLTNLEELGVGAHAGLSFASSLLSPMGKTFMDLRLEAGLGRLSKLKRLRLLAFDCKEPQKMGMDEARWMVRQWPRLREVRGLLSESWAVRVSMQALLHGQGVEVVCDDTLHVSF